jgi:hypothetical protein
MEVAWVDGAESPQYPHSMSPPAITAGGLGRSTLAALAEDCYSRDMQEIEAIVWCKYDTQQRCWSAKSEMFEMVEGLGHNPQDALQQLKEAVLWYLRTTRQSVPVRIQFRPL